MLYTNAIFGRLSIEEFNTAPRTIKYQEILSRSKAMFYDSNIADYDPLKQTFDKSFYRLTSVQHVVKEWENLHLIAYNVYGDNDFWWLLGEYNRVIDPFNLKQVKVIGLPVKNQLITWLIERVYK